MTRERPETFDPPRDIQRDEAAAMLRECGADRVTHSGRTLMDHLVGTCSLLEAWGNPEPVCMAGLFHSIYGTTAFLRRSLQADEREQLRAVIGAEAEAMAWTFCAIDRPRAILELLPQLGHDSVPPLHARPGIALSEPIIASHAQARALAEIECANLIEQQRSGAVLRKLYCAAVSYPGTLTPSACSALRRHLSQQLASPAKINPEAWR